MDDCASGWNRDTKSVCVPGKVPWSNFTENCFLFCSKHCDLDTGKMAILIILIYITVKFNQLETAACIAPEMFFPAPTSTTPPRANQALNSCASCYDFPHLVMSLCVIKCVQAVFSVTRKWVILFEWLDFVSFRIIGTGHDFALLFGKRLLRRWACWHSVCDMPLCYFWIKDNLNSQQ